MNDPSLELLRDELFGGKVLSMRRMGAWLHVGIEGTPHLRVISWKEAEEKALEIGVPSFLVEEIRIGSKMSIMRTGDEILLVVNGKVADVLSTRQFETALLGEVELRRAKFGVVH